MSRRVEKSRSRRGAAAGRSRDSWTSGASTLVFALVLLIAGVLPLPAATDSTRMQVQITNVPDQPVWVGQKVSLNVRVLLAERPEGLIRFDVPEGEGGVFLQLQESPYFGSDKVDDISFTTWNYTFLFYPHRAGTARIPSMTVRARVGKDDPVDLAAATEVIELTAKMPDGAESLATLVATTGLEVKETWSPRPPGDAKVGDAFTRTITLSAPDVLAMGFPVPEFAATDTLRVYPKSPATRDRIERGEITGRRIETVVYICQQEGPARIPALIYPWLDLGSDSLETIELPAHSFEVAPNPALTAVATQVDSAPAPTGRTMLVGAAIVLGLGLLGWRIAPRVRQRLADWRQRREASESAVFRRLVNSIEHPDPPAYHAESRQWLRTLPGENATTLPLFAERNGEAELANLLSAWLAGIYGNGPVTGQAREDLARELVRVRSRVHASHPGPAALPPLNGSESRREDDRTATQPGGPAAAGTPARI